MYGHMYVCIYVCIDSSARRPNHTEFEKTTQFEKTTARIGAVREASEERPGGVREASGGRLGAVREASEERPGGVRGAPGSCPKGVQIVFPRRAWQNRARALQTLEIPYGAV